MKAAAGFLLAALAVPVQAVFVPAQGPADPRVRTAVYDPMQVYPLTAFAGYVIEIEFARGERFLPRVGGGDAASYTIDYVENYVTIKPKVADKTETNLTIFTSRGPYHFTYRILGEPSAAVEANCRLGSRDCPMILGVKFHYPQDVAAAKAAEEQREREVARRAEFDARRQSADTSRPRNHNYLFQTGSTQ